MGFLDGLKRLFAGADAPPTGTPPPSAPTPGMNPNDGMTRIGAIRAARAAELETTPAERMRVYSIFREALNTEAHDYVDLVLAHPQREAVLELQVGVAMEAYFAGVMARRGWISEMDAHQGAYGLGRMFRQRLGGLGIQLTQVKLTIGSVIDNSLREIVKAGLAAPT
jgi:hypothetical protein